MFRHFVEKIDPTVFKVALKGKSMHGRLFGMQTCKVVFPWGVSLIAGMVYGMERWNGKWNGTVNVHS